MVKPICWNDGVHLSWRETKSGESGTAIPKETALALTWWLVLGNRMYSVVRVARSLLSRTDYRRAFFALCATYRICSKVKNLKASLEFCVAWITAVYLLEKNKTATTFIFINKFEKMAETWQRNDPKPNSSPYLHRISIQCKNGLEKLSGDMVRFIVWIQKERNLFHMHSQK